MARHIGIIAVSPEGSALCYRDLARRASDVAELAARPLVSVHNLPFSNYVDAFNRGDWEHVGTMLRWSAETLAAAGADFCIVPDNIAHHALGLAEAGAPIPMLNMIELVAHAISRDGCGAVGLVGTKLLMQSSTYQTILGLRGVRVLAPSEEDADELDRIIFKELVHGRVEPTSRERVLRVIERLGEEGCEGVILGSTETPLLVSQGLSPLPTYDPVALLVEGALSRSLEPA